MYISILIITQICMYTYFQSHACACAADGMIQRQIVDNVTHTDTHYSRWE